MCSICDDEGCLNCDPNPDNICECGNPDCEGECGYWVDPAGGIHSHDEDNPAKQYE